MRGLTFVAPPRPFRSDPIQPIAALGSDCIAVIPYAYTRPGQPSVRYDNAQWQWWGERPEGVRASIALARQAGLKVMLKPQVYVPGSWTGQLALIRRRIGRVGSRITRHILPIWRAWPIRWGLICSVSGLNLADR